MSDYDIIPNKYGNLVVVDAKTGEPLTGKRLEEVEKKIEQSAVFALQEIANSIGRE